MVKTYIYNHACWLTDWIRNVQSTPALSRKCGRAVSVPHSVSQREREREIKRERERERDVEYGCFSFIFKRNDGCLCTFKLSSNLIKVLKYTYQMLFSTAGLKPGIMVKSCHYFTSVPAWLLPPPPSNLGTWQSSTFFAKKKFQKKFFFDRCHSRPRFCVTFWWKHIHPQKLLPPRFKSPLEPTNPVPLRQEGVGLRCRSSGPKPGGVNVE